MADETTAQSDYTTVQLHKDLAKQVRLLAVQRETSVKVEMDRAVASYLQAESDTPAQHRVAAQA
jgi:predicted transcriptional regulator